MSKLTESAIEDLAIRLFERLGYSHIYIPDVISWHIRPMLMHGEVSEAM